MIITSPSPPVEIPSVPLADYILEHAHLRADHAALIDGSDGREVTYEALCRHVDAVAVGLAEHGLASGDVVGIFAQNVVEYPAAFLGVTRAGGINTTINALATASEAADQLRCSGARLVITTEALADRAVPAAAEVGIPLIGIGEVSGARPFDDLLATPGSPRAVAIDTSTHLASLPYSSGTTGLPKAVMLTHRNLIANVAQTGPGLAIDGDDVLIAILPFFHIYGQTVVMNAALRVGATIVTLPRFDLEAFLGTIERYRVTRAFVAPPVVLALAKHPLVERFDLTSLDEVFSGAAPLGADLAEEASARLGCPVVQGYGLTEASPVLTLVDHEGINRPGSIGPLVPNTEARIVDPDAGTDAAYGEPGELLVRGPQVMIGYLDDPDATAATLDGDGWLRTGDIVVADADGWFTVVDRAKELIKYKGYQVAPAELEALLVTHPHVADACVVGVPDAEAGENPKAFIVASGELTADALIAWVAERVAPYKRIRLVEFIDEIPKSASGKILRRILAERS